ncbi:prepilin-type N-terminal cleavage/methylation domain-containing protein [Geomonas sp. RF6]|uniref:prepilin-type N-terminal cleavage/methylation domain-containing protein n=1 Tax=Geomonas sp. RF6 TaxID=2897342 RepID=UPI001E524B43|nr:prepilin-type N-terminal cleavage/methylation domain-containing protein [Geomonas sp. RF6]UFS69644.1 prepilin-type N-terminal cleavage/methylation domain-containing protein [Geomonas sp. RF6]
MLRSSSPSSEEGFTLIEMLAALLVMMIGLLGLLQAVIVALEYDTRNVLREESVRLAEKEMNAFRLAAGHQNDGDFKMAAFGDRTKEESTIDVPLQIRGGGRLFTVTREYQSTGGKSRRLLVRVSYNYRGDRLQHEIYTIKSNR